MTANVNQTAAKKLAQGKKNWISWENKFKSVSKAVGLGDSNTFPSYTTHFHILKLIIYFFVFVSVFCISVGIFPSFNKLSFTKLLIFSLIGESLGFSCSSGILGGNMMPGDSLFPLWWHNIHTGTLKQPSFQCLPKVRNMFDVIMFYVYITLLCFAFATIGNDSIHHSWQIFCIILFFIYFWIFDRVVFLSSRTEYYGAFLFCMYFENGWLIGCQCVQISVWFWAGISKMGGPWFSYVFPMMTAHNPLQRLLFGKEKFPVFIRSLYRNFPLDLRPSSLAINGSTFGVMLEIGAALLVINDYTRIYGVLCAILLHSFIIVNFPIGAVQEWNICLISFCLYLFYFQPTIEWISMLSAMDHRLQLMLCWILIIVPFVCTLKPDWIDFLLGFRYYAGNWEQGLWLINRSAWDKFILPSLTVRNPIKAGTDVKYLDWALAFRIMATPTGKSLLNLMHMLTVKHAVSVGHKLNMDDYILWEQLSHMVYGWQWCWSEHVIAHVRVKYDMYAREHFGLKRKSECVVDRYDMIQIYIKAIPTFSFFDESKFRWKIEDFEQNIIDEGTFTLAEIDSTPHFT